MIKPIITALAITLSLLSCPIYGQPITFSYIAPVPGSKYINPEQSIILKTRVPFDLESINGCAIEITGSESGTHSFTWKVSKDNCTIVIIPDSHFSFGEFITVNVLEGLVTLSNAEVSDAHFSFRIKTQDNLPMLKEFYRREFIKETSFMGKQNVMNPSRLISRDNNLPSDYAAPEMIHYEETDDKYLFMTLNPRAGAPDYNNYLSINDKYGVPLFFRKTQNNCMNFHLMDDGKLAYGWNDYGNPENEKYYLMDSSYVVIDSVKTGNGYNMDGHDIVLMENGNYLLMSYDPQLVDMSLIVLGGNPNATVVGLIIQEVDLFGTVFFQWRSWDHFQITDATDDIDLTASNIDYVHGNAFIFDLDGNILLSSRHLDEITKIDYQTGDIIYRFGLLSNNNEFVISNDPVGFSHQHDVKVLPNGNITIYDNGNLHPNPYSQAIEYSINESVKTANRVWYYQNDPNIYGPSTGSYRRAEDGKNLIGWGANWPLAATEVLPDDTKTFETYLPDNVVSYRVIKDSWNTNLFTAPPQIQFGNYEGNTGPIYMILPIQNNSDQLIRVTSIFNHTEHFGIIDALPVNVPSDEVIELSVSFYPDSLGVFNDRLTLNYDKFGIGATERIARQVKLSGIWDNSLPLVTFIPEYGTFDVDPESEVTVSFSEPIRKIGGDPIQNGDIPDLFSFTVSNLWGDSVHFAGTISEDRQLITLIPTDILNEMEQYFVELHASTIEDDDGTVIGQPEATVFKTGLNLYRESNNDLNHVMFFPSPFDDRLIIVSKKQTIEEIYIYDISGIEIYNSHSSDNKIEINTKLFPEGIYLVKVIDKLGKVTLSKVVKVK
jgi:hypothetical protein